MANTVNGKIEYTNFGHEKYTTFRHKRDHPRHKVYHLISGQFSGAMAVFQKKGRDDMTCTARLANKQKKPYANHRGLCTVFHNYDSTSMPP